MDEFNERDEQLIREREEYEEMFFSHVVDEMMSDEEMDRLIAQRINYIDEHFDFEPTPEYEQLEEIYLREDTEYLDYGNQFEFDGDEYFDVIFDDIFEDMDAGEEEHYKKIADEQIEDEKRYFDGVLADAIQEQLMFEKAIDKLIFEYLDQEYDEAYFDYDFDDYWYEDDDIYYGGEVWPEDESVKDPFDSFGEIDYPEGEPKHEYQEPPEIYVENDFEEEYRLYDLKIERQMEMEESRRINDDFDKYAAEHDSYSGDEEFIEPVDDIDDMRNEELINSYEPLDDLVKDYFTRDDTLDRIIGEKLREKKFKGIK